MEAKEEIEKYARKIAGQMNGIYQRCPACYGEGAYYSLFVNEKKKCLACDGTGLINQLTGKPPK